MVCIAPSSPFFVAPGPGAGCRPLADLAGRPGGLAGPVADALLYLGRLHALVRLLVADDEEVPAPAPLLVAVDRGVARHEVHRELVGLGHLPATAALQHEAPEV